MPIVLGIVFTASPALVALLTASMAPLYLVKSSTEIYGLVVKLSNLNNNLDGPTIDINF